MSGFIELLDHQFKENSSRPAVIYRDQIFTFGELAERARGIGVFLRQKGLKTGDIVILYTPEKLCFLLIHLGDDDGYLFLVGRKNDLVITSGFNAYPPVVERVIDEFPGVKESAVIGIPDAIKGEKVMAVIVPGAAGKVDIDELKKHCREKLVNYQCPVAFELVEELPRNTMGKVLKRELKEKFSSFLTVPFPLFREAHSAWSSIRSTEPLIPLLRDRENFAWHLNDILVIFVFFPISS